MVSSSGTINSGSPATLATRLIAAVTLLFWAGIILAASHAGAVRLWGVNHLAFTPPAVIWWFLAALTIACILVLYPGRLNALPSMSSARLGAWRYGVLLAVAVGAAGWLLRAQVGLLGDGIMRAYDAVSIATPMPSELLPSALSMLLARHVPAAWGIDGYSALRIISIASGVLLTLGLWWLAPKTGIKRPYWFTFWILTFGSFRLFAGYLETYAPAVAFGILWTIASIAYRKGNTGAVTVIVLWTLAFLSHATMILLAPATVFVLFWGRETPRPNWRPALVFALIAAGLGAYIGLRMHALQIGGLGAGTGYFFLSLVSDPRHRYGIFSPYHLVDLQNHLVLLTPAFFAALLAKLFNWGREQRAASGRKPNGQLFSPAYIFWTLAAGVPIVVGLLIDPKLGWARDWDLFTLFFTPFMVGAALWLAGLDASPVRRAAAAVALLSLGLWLVFSANADAETRRFKALLELDPSRGDYGHEILALHYREINQPDNEIEQYIRALAVSDNIRYRGNIAAACIRAGRNNESIAWYQSILERDSTFDIAIYGMAVALQYVGRFADALPYAEAAVKAAPDDPEHQYTLGAIQSRLSDFESALPHLEFAARARPDEISYLNPLGGCYLQLKRYQEARAVWHQLMKLDPDFAPVYLNAASLELTTQNLAESRRLLGEYERLTPAENRRPEAQWLADSLTRAGY